MGRRLENCRIVILGSMASYSGEEEGTSGQALIVGKDIYLIDCGFGTLSSMLWNNLSPDRIKGIFISHSHLDHVGGLPEILWYFENKGRKDPISICSLEEIKNLPEVGFPIVWEDIDIKGIMITAVPLKHRILTRGYIFEENPEDFPVLDINRLKKDGIPEKEWGNVKDQYLKILPARFSYAYMSDTQFDEGLVGALQGVKTLYHEATYEHKDKAKALKWMHSTGTEAGEIARRIGCKKLIIGHFSHAANSDLILKDAKVKFKNTVKAECGLLLDLLR